MRRVSPGRGLASTLVRRSGGCSWPSEGCTSRCLRSWCRGAAGPARRRGCRAVGRPEGCEIATAAACFGSAAVALLCFPIPSFRRKMLTFFFKE